jgi:hypothetical protein
LFERTAKSEQNDGNPAAGNDVELWGWVEREAELSKGSNGTMANNKTALEKEDAIEELWSGDDKVTMTVNVKGKGVNLDFTITKRLLDGSIAYDAECVGESQESQAISQSLASRKPLNNLPFLMVSQAVLLIHKPLTRIKQDMVHSFKDLRTARCVKCNRLLDQRGLLPTSRRQAEMKTMDKVNVDKVWQAVHEGCL